MPYPGIYNIPEYAVQTDLLRNFHKIKIRVEVWIFEIARYISFTGAFKTHFVRFQKQILSQTKIVNENNESISIVLPNFQGQHANT